MARSRSRRCEGGPVIGLLDLVRARLGWRRRPPPADAAREQPPEPDAADVLVADHRELQGLLDRAAAAPGPAQEAGLLGELADRIHAHVSTEESVVHHALRAEAGNMGELLDLSDGRHATIGQLVALLRNLGAGDDRLPSVLASLAAEFGHDVDLEERSILPEARDALSRERLVELGRAVRERLEAAGAHV